MVIKKFVTMQRGHLSIKYFSGVIVAEDIAKDKGGRNSVGRLFRMSKYSVREDFVLTVKRADHR
jgi:hypothetical protein